MSTLMIIIGLALPTSDIRLTQVNHSSGKANTPLSDQVQPIKFLTSALTLVEFM